MTTDNVLPWNPNVNGTVYSILPAGSNVYLGGSFTTVGGATHKNIAEVNNTNGALVTAFANNSKPNKAVRAMVSTRRSCPPRSARSPPRCAAAARNWATSSRS